MHIMIIVEQSRRYVPRLPPVPLFYERAFLYACYFQTIVKYIPAASPTHDTPNGINKYCNKINTSFILNENPPGNERDIDTVSIFVDFELWM